MKKDKKKKGSKAFEDKWLNRDTAVGIVVVLVLLAVIGVVAYYAFSGPKNSSDSKSKADSASQEAEKEAVDIGKLVKKLNKANTKLYVNENCSHCQRQKEAFGSHFKDLNAIYYKDNPKAFEENKIQGTPTWIINGKKHVGFKTLSQLKEIVNK